MFTTEVRKRMKVFGQVHLQDSEDHVHTSVVNEEFMLTRSIKNEIGNGAAE